MFLAWAVKIVNILVSFLFDHLTHSINAEDVKGKATSLPNHEKDKHVGKHRNPRDNRSQRGDSGFEYFEDLQGDGDGAVQKHLDEKERQRKKKDSHGQ